MSNARERNLALDVVRVCEAAALSSARTTGRGDLAYADDIAVDSMRRAFATLDICGTVVVGEGEPSEAPKLYVGERVGRWQPRDPEVEIALDPLEGTRLCARGMPNAISVLALTQGGEFLRAVDSYMDKIAVGPGGRGVIDITKSATENLHAVADAKGVYVEDLCVVILDRPRHEALIREVREAGARIRLITDGDVAAAISTCIEETGVDMLVGVGGSAEGVLAAAAMRCAGGDMVGRLKPRNQQEIQRLVDSGIKDVDKVLTLNDLASGDVVFSATGITDGDFLKGVRWRRGGAVTHSVVMRSRTMTIRFIQTQHRFDGRPEFGEL
ncbi:MAG: class II fructose-bisphosphatase [Myxococcales bacterium]|nr:class II fructose-bisphosphatase [Myxococcales bacterium]